MTVADPSETNEIDEDELEPALNLPWTLKVLAIGLVVLTIVLVGLAAAVVVHAVRAG
jgi:hypothetical protein